MAIYYSRSSIQNTYCRRLWIRKKNALLNIINDQSDIDKDPYKAKYQYLINKREKVGLNHFNVPNDMIADMINNKKLNSIVS